MLTELRAAHRKMAVDTGDLGLIPEAELNEQRGPGGKWSVTADPEVWLQARQDHDSLRDRRRVDCLSRRQELSRRRSGPLELYSQPVAVSAGETIQCKACRLGYRDSQNASAERLP